MKFKKVLVSDGDKYLYDKGDVYTPEGIIKEEDIISKKEVRTNKGKIFKVFPAGFHDILEKIKRGPQIIVPKDAGAILAHTNLDKNSVVVEAGTGCGALTLHLARFVKHVYTYEIRKDHYEIARKNFQMFDIENITLKNRDISLGIQEKNIDMVILDMPDPEKIRKKAYECLKSGGYLVIYVPQITQVKEFVETCKDFFYIERTLEVLEREWHTEKKIYRPKNQMLGHTGFLVFTRKI